MATFPVDEERLVEPSKLDLVSRGPEVLFDRVCRVTVGGWAVDGLRVGFTVERSVDLTANTAEIVVYNMNPWTRQRLDQERSAAVHLEAGYREAGTMTLFAGEMREAFSRAESDGTWATVLRAGDGDEALTSRQNSLAVRPGASLLRVLQEQVKVLGIGMGNALSEIAKQLKGGNVDATTMQHVISEIGVNAVGNSARITKQLLDRAGMEVSVQNGQLQVMKKGAVVGTRAVVLGFYNGLEGVPEVNRNGDLRCRARLVPGLVPGHPIQIERPAVAGIPALNQPDILTDRMTVYRIEKVRYVGDTHGPDWNAEIEARDVKATPKEVKKARRK